MTVSAGTRLGPYEIESLLGSGGMGEVYKARDTRLGRAVAIKVLPPELAADPVRLQRFEQEARAVSALDHPHICVLFDVGTGVPTNPESRPSTELGAALSLSKVPAPSPEPVHYLVLEYLDGQTLADALRRKGRLPVEQALDCAVQIADALAAAHRHGIVHRDLKPDNVLLTKAGAKVLDFGVARLAPRPDHDAQAGAGSTSEMLVGTVPYMAPEQVEGRPVDARADLFGLGALLYEMLTGTRAFDGKSPAGVMAAILEHEPRAASQVHAGIPPAIDRVIARCLAKDPDARWQTASDLGAELRWLRENRGEASPAVTGGRRRRRGWWVALVVAGGLAMALAGAGAMRLMHPPEARGALSRLSLDVGPAEELNAGGVNTTWLPTPGGSRTALAWTPDGQTLVFVGRRGGVQQLYMRRLDAAEARPLAGTEGAQAPAVSADGQWVAFWARRAIRKVPLGGGPTMELVSNVGVPPRGLVWGTRGRVYFSKEPDGTIWQVPAEGAPSAVPTGGTATAKHSLPWPLPDERALLYTVRSGERAWGDEEVVAFTLATGQRKILLKDASDARYVPTGHLLFLRRGMLFAVPFDAGRLEIHGTPVAVLETVAQALTGGHASDATGAGQYAFASTGTLAWLPGPATPVLPRELVTVDRGGHVSPLPAPVREYDDEVRLSPDGRWLAVTIRTLTEDAPWLYDLGRGTLTPLARGGEAYAPVWSPDGQRLMFSWLEGGQRSLVSQPADGTAPPRALAPGWVVPASFAPDGRQLAALSGDVVGEVVIVTVENGKARVQPFLQTPDREWWPAFSPDGRWLAYGSNVSGRDEVYVRPYPGPGPAQQVSVDTGHSPAWNPSGKELLFVRRVQGATGESSMMAVEFGAGPPVTIGQPRLLFTFYRRALQFSCAPVRCYDVAPDGQRFYVVQTPNPPPPPVVTHVNLIVNWFEDLKAKVPVAK